MALQAYLDQLARPLMAEKKLLARAAWDGTFAQQAFDRRLAWYLELALANVPFYAARRSEYDRPFSEWPVLDRALIRRHAGEFVNPQAKAALSTDLRRSTGTTGVPVETVHTIFSLAYWQIQQSVRWASGCMGAKLRFYPWSAVAFLTTISDDHEYVIRCPGLGFARGLKFNPEHATLATTMSKIAKLKAKFLALDPMVMEYLLKSNAVALPEFVHCSGSTLQENLRSEFESRFGVQVFRDYKSSEFELIGFECGYKQGYHVFNSSLRIEILDPRTSLPLPEGEFGEVTITSLRNLAQPLFRYRMGDLGSLDTAPCSCGLRLPRLRGLNGRSSVQLERADGTRINPGFLYDKFQDLPVTKWQVVQSGQRFTVKLRFKDGVSSEETASVHAQIFGVIREMMGAEIEVEFGPLAEAELGRKFESVLVVPD